MNVVLRRTYVCPVCGWRGKGALFASVRINKKSMRTLGTSLAWAPHRCDECGCEDIRVAEPLARLDKESAEKVRAYRARKSWDA